MSCSSSSQGNNGKSARPTVYRLIWRCARCFADFIGDSGCSAKRGKTVSHAGYCPRPIRLRSHIPRGSRRDTESVASRANSEVMTQLTGCTHRVQLASSLVKYSAVFWRKSGGLVKLRWKVIEPISGMEPSVVQIPDFDRSFRATQRLNPMSRPSVRSAYWISVWRVAAAASFSRASVGSCPHRFVCTWDAHDGCDGFLTAFTLGLVRMACERASEGPPVYQPVLSQLLEADLISTHHCSGA